MPWRNVIVLSLSLALGVSGLPMMLLLGGIIGTQLAPSPALATLPIAVTVVGQALTSVPAALLMSRIGRRRGFVGAMSVAIAGALVAASAVAVGSFLLLCLASLLIGANSAFVQQYRFAASESVEPERSGRAVSLVLVGGMVAGFLGPEIGRRGQHWLAAGPYVGSFVGLAVMCTAALILLLWLRDVPLQKAESEMPPRPLREILSVRTFQLAVLMAVVGYGAMSFIMTATPVYLHTQLGYGLEDATRVIQSHIIAMYLPSLFTGFLIERLGLVRLATLGVLAMTACVGIAILGRELLHLWGALVLLGIGWNLLFVGGTVLLTRSYRPSERFKAQAANEFVVFGIQAITSLSAGTVLFYANWHLLNLLNLPALAIALLAIVVFRRQIATA